MHSENKLSTLETHIGRQLQPLTSEWENVKQIVDTHKKYNHELFFSTSSSIDQEYNQPSKKVFMLVKHESGYFTGMWVDPDNAYDVALMSQNYEEALTISEQALSEDPKNPELLFNKAYALAQLGRHEEALDYYNKVLELDTNDAGAWNNKACTLSELGDNDAAEECFKKAVSLNPNSALYNLNYANAMLARNNVQEYNRYVELALKTPDTPDNQIALHNLGVETGIYSTADLYGSNDEDFNFPPPSLN